MTGKAAVALVVGAVLGLPLGGAVGGALHYVLSKKAEVEARRGWNLAPVVVAARAMPPGTEVAFEDVLSRSIPEQFVTSSVVKPDGASYVVKQPLLVPVAAGEPLRWSYFAVTQAKEGGAAWLEQVDERAACAQRVKALGFAPRALSPEAVRDSLGGTAR